jgi:hypothetical protein
LEAVKYLFPYGTCGSGKGPRDVLQYLPWQIWHRHSGAEMAKQARLKKPAGRSVDLTLFQGSFGSGREQQIYRGLSGWSSENVAVICKNKLTQEKIKVILADV